MQVRPSHLGAEIAALASYPYQVTLPARFGDVAPSGEIEHIGMARCYEDVRGAWKRDLTGRRGVDRDVLRSFLVRAINDQTAPASYPEPIAFGAGVIAVGGSSFTLEVVAFQAGVCIGRSQAMAVAVGPDYTPAPLPEEARAILSSCLLTRLGWRAPGKPAPERRQLAAYPHHLTLPTRFSDTDAVGHLNNVSLLRYCDEGRAALLLQGEDRPAPPWPGQVVRVDISYLREARLPQPLTIGSAIRRIDGPHVHLEQALFQREACVVVCDCIVQMAPQMAQRLRERAARF
jgi:acyl-CoA thioester hydrolase